MNLICFFIVYSFLIGCNSPEASTIWERVLCSVTDLFNSECCRSARVDFRVEEFKQAIEGKLYGQPFAAEKLAKVVSKHWDEKSMPSKALVLILQGPTGVGKTYITKILSKYTFAKGDKSQFYHFFSGMKHFPFTEEQVQYKKQLRDSVQKGVAICEKSLFVFDEIEKMPVSVLDSLKPFVDYSSVIDGVDFRRSIFIFLTNTGSDVIMKAMVNWKRQGKDRAEFRLESLEQELSENVFTNEESSLKGSELLKHHLISHFIPFLPLEREHVKMCIKERLDEVNRASLGTEEFVNRVLEQMPFVPKEELFFSSYGCKRVPEKVDDTVEETSWSRETRQNRNSEF